MKSIELQLEYIKNKTMKLRKSQNLNNKFMKKLFDIEKSIP